MRRGSNEDDDYVYAVIIGLGEVSGKKEHKHANLVIWREPKRKKRKSIDWFGINHWRNIEESGCKNTLKILGVCGVLGPCGCTVKCFFF